ncbi:hypothetical protein HPS57_02410 [Prevotella sp. PINT]|jgi:hypothetical protein|uniref:hypothetical protein n=1 Tax=Palleniella intestinalis TaxID=2736291 RepID=UPI001552E459|nr:hypothetical protein [Palleniella intestinalis]NPD80831.1 hypothetical protein [Palleniella intestinalis]
MQYGQIVFLLFVALLFYYAALIVMDIQRAKAAQAAEQDNHSEEDIDISDEAQTFKPFKISRDEPEKQADSSDDKFEQNQTSNTEKVSQHSGYREAIMTDGILVEKLIDEIERLVETGTCDLGTVIFNCENAR